jgi:hypothetical protein
MTALVCVFAVWPPQCCALAADTDDHAAGLHRVAEGKVDATQREKAARIANDLLAGWREKRFRWLPDDFSLEMIRGLPPADQEKAQDTLRFLFGDFQRLEYVEAYASTASPSVAAYRFKGIFSAANSPPEVRVSFGPGGRIIVFLVRHWKDELE